MWTPYKIEIILHYSCRYDPFPRSDAPIFAGTISDLILAGVLVDGDDGRISATDLGKALVTMWCRTPLPVMSFIDPRTREEI